MTIIKDNISAVKALSDFIKPALGPDGSYKLIIDSVGDLFITRNGSEIVSKLNVKHPLIKVIVNASKTMNQLGDGSIRVILLINSLLSEAEKLMSKGLHPNRIIKGFNTGLRMALKLLRKQHSSDLLSVLKTKTSDDELLNILMKVNPDKVKVLTRKGSGYELINGVVINKEKPHPLMPSRVDDARILITKKPIEVKELSNAELEINNPSMIKSFINKSGELITEIVNKIIDSGANVVLCQRGISDKAQELFARKGVLAIRRVRSKDIDLLVKGTGARLVNDFNEISLGKGSVETKWFGDERLTIIKCDNYKTIIQKSPFIIKSEELINSCLNLMRTYNNSDLTVNPCFNELINYHEGVESLAVNALGKSLKIIEGRGLLIIKEQLLKTSVEIACMILRINEIIRK